MFFRALQAFVSALVALLLFLAPAVLFAAFFALLLAVSARADDGVASAGGSNGLPTMPRAIPGLVFWLDAADSSTITQSSGSISAWLDKAGGLSVAQATGTYQPSVATGAAPSGLNGVTFSASAKTGLATTAKITLPTSITVFVAGSFSNTGANTGGFFMEQSTVYSNPGFHVESDNGQSFVHRGSNLWYSAGRTDFGANNRPTIYDWNISSAGQFSYISGGLMPNGALTGTYAAVGESNITDYLYVGARAGGGTGGSLWTSGTAYEVLIYKGSLSAAQSQAVRNYLGNKWGVYTPSLAQMSYTVANVVDSSDGPTFNSGLYQGTYIRNSVHSEAIYSTTATSLTLDSWDNGAYDSWPTLTTFGVYVNGTYNQTLSDAVHGVNHLSATLPAGAKTVAVTQGGVQSASASYPPITGNYVIGISFNAPAKQLFPTGEGNLVIYGDSICMGQAATPINENSWVELVRAGWTHGTVGATCWGWRSLYQDYYYNSSSISTLALSIESMNPTIVWIAIGTNDFGLNNAADGSSPPVPSSWTPTAFGTQYAALLDRLHTDMPTVPIFAQSPIVRTDAYGAANANYSGYHLTDFRSAIQSAATARSSFVTYVDGTTLLSSGGLSADGLHPSTTGHSTYASNVLNTWLPTLP